MDPRLDPSCAGAQALEASHREQELLLVGGSEGQLATLVRQRHERQLIGHLAGCEQCAAFRRACPSCGFDPTHERHGWRCPAAGPTWREWLPWNWRPRRAPTRSARDARATYETDGARATRPASPTPFTSSTSSTSPTSPAHASRAARAPPPSRATRPARASVSPPAAKPSPSPLAHAYAVLGVPSSASQAQVRAAFRERAQQYHPDKVAHMAPEFRDVAEKKMKEVNEAYDRIKKTWSS